jgi:hypothetical protein
VERAAQRSALVRDAGLRRIVDVTRWLIAAAAGLSGALALFAAGAFHGHAIASNSPTAAAASVSHPGNNVNALQTPSQAPLPAASAPVVVSGGS